MCFFRFFYKHGDFQVCRKITGLAPILINFGCKLFSILRKLPMPKSPVTPNNLLDLWDNPLATHSKKDIISITAKSVPKAYLLTTGNHLIYKYLKCGIKRCGIWLCLTSCLTIFAVTKLPHINNVLWKSGLLFSHLLRDNHLHKNGFWEDIVVYIGFSCLIFMSETYLYFMTVFVYLCISPCNVV